MSYEDTRISYQRGILALALVGILTLSEVRVLSAQERTLEGSFELGNRWRWLAGNEDVYRSTINLGRGPKLQSFSATFTPKTGEPSVFDRASIDMTGWGGEPAGSLRFLMGSQNRYQLSLNYRHFDYFNSLPSFANPTAARAGSTQSSMDVSRRLADGRLTFRPHSGISPYVAFEFDSTNGPGRTNFVQDSNEYSVATNIDNATTTAKGGVAFRFERWSGGFEAGTSGFHDAQNINVAGPNLGNRTTLFLGQRLQLDSLQQNYDVSGSDRFTRVFLQARPWRNLTLTGQYSYSRPTSETTYQDNGSGRFVLLSTLEMFTGSSTLARTQASFPHPSGSVGVEFRPIDRLRIVETVSADQFRIHGDGSSMQGFTSSSRRVSESFDETLRAKFTRQRLDVIFDLNSIASLHAGHSYLTANATSPGSLLAASESHDLKRNVADLGMTLRFNRLKMNVDFDDERGDATFFRTDRRDFQRLRARGRYRVFETLEFGLMTSVWNNDNTADDVDFVERSREESVEVQFIPAGGKVGVEASYGRGTFRSDLPIIVPQNFQKERSVYRDRGHNGSLVVTLKPIARVQASLGGDLFISTDDRSTRFYNPFVRASYMLKTDAAFVTEWRWHGYSNRSYPHESFQAHLLTTGIEYRFQD